MYQRTRAERFRKCQSNADSSSVLSARRGSPGIITYSLISGLIQTKGLISVTYAGKRSRANTIVSAMNCSMQAKESLFAGGSSAIQNNGDVVAGSHAPTLLVDTFAQKLDACVPDYWLIKERLGRESSGQKDSLSNRCKTTGGLTLRRLQRALLDLIQSFPLLCSRCSASRQTSTGVLRTGRPPLKNSRCSAEGARVITVHHVPSRKIDTCSGIWYLFHSWGHRESKSRFEQRPKSPDKLSEFQEVGTMVYHTHDHQQYQRHRML
jgi:hypothetical protein